MAKVALVPFVHNFADYAPIIESDLVDAWDKLMTIAMSGVASRTQGLLSAATAPNELRESLTEWWDGGGEVFEDYYNYTKFRTEEARAPWSAVSAMWVAENLRLQSNANADLRRNTKRLDFVNQLSAFMNMSFGSSDVGFSHFLGIMTLEIEREAGIDVGLGAKGARKNDKHKIMYIADIYKTWARDTVKVIAERDI